MKRTSQTVFLLALALLAALVFVQSPGTTDVDIWTNWVKNASLRGPVSGFALNQADYPPLSTVFLWAGNQFFQVFDLSIFRAIKVTILVFLLLTTLAFWLWTRDGKLTLLLYFALLLNSMALGYLDIFFAPSLVAALWMLHKRRYAWFSLFYATACLTKWQPLLIAPFIALYLLQSEDSRPWRIFWRKVFPQAVLPALALSVGCTTLFGLDAMLNAFRASISHPYLSGNALNLNWIITHALHLIDPQQYGPLQRGLAEYIVDAPSQVTFGPRLLFAATYLFAVLAFARREKTFRNLVLFASTGFLAYFTFNTGVHENHLFLVSILAVVLFWLDPTWWATALVILLMNNINLFAFYGVDGEIHFHRAAFGVDVALPLAIFNVLFCLYFLVNVSLSTRKSQQEKAHLPPPSFAS